MVGDFFAARADDIDRQLVANGPYGRFSTVEANGLTEVTIATLERASEGPEAQGSEADDGETGVLAIPSAMRDALATAGDLSTVAERWAATDELSLDEWNVEDAMEVLREVRELARGARAADCELWYWWSL
jgi:hypothetical protein